MRSTISGYRGLHKCLLKWSYLSLIGCVIMWKPDIGKQPHRTRFGTSIRKQFQLSLKKKEMKYMCCSNNKFKAREAISEENNILKWHMHCLILADVIRYEPNSFELSTI